MGQPGQKTGGRQKGVPNKDTQSLFEICEKHGVDVFEGMVLLAVQTSDADAKFSRLQALAQYLYPKRKAVEVTGDEKGFQVTIKDYTKE